MIHRYPITLPGMIATQAPEADAVAEAMAALKSEVPGMTQISTHFAGKDTRK